MFKTLKLALVRIGGWARSSSILTDGFYLCHKSPIENPSGTLTGGDLFVVCGPDLSYGSPILVSRGQKLVSSALPRMLPSN